MPATPSPSRPQVQQQFSNICRFLGKDTIDETDLPRLEALQAELVAVLMVDGKIEYHNKSGGAAQTLLKVPSTATDKASANTKLGLIGPSKSMGPNPSLMMMLLVALLKLNTAYSFIMAPPWMLDAGCS